MALIKVYMADPFTDEGIYFNNTFLMASLFNNTYTIIMITQSLMSFLSKWKCDGSREGF